MKDVKKQKIQKYTILSILLIVVGVGVFVTQKIFSKQLPPNILTGLLVVTIVLLFAELVAYFLFGRDNDIKAEDRKNPPKNMDGFLLGYLDTGEVFSNHYASLVVSLATKGYIKMKKLENGEVLISKKKELDNNLSKYERFMYKILFKNDSESISTKEIYESDGRYFQQMETIIKGEYSSKRNVETPISRKIRKVIALIFSILLVASMVIYSQFAYISILSRIIFVVVLTALSGMMYYLLNDLIISFQTGKEVSIKNGALVATIFILCGNIVFPYFIIHFSNVGIMFMSQLNILLLCVIINGFIFKRSESLDDILAKVMGFRNTLEEYDVAKINQLYDENREYFYRILPYLFSFDMSLVLFDENDREIDCPDFYETLEIKDKITFNEFNIDVNTIDSSIIESY